MRTEAILFLAGSLVVAACSSSPERGTFQESGPEGQGSIGNGAPPPATEECQKMDVLFVVDDSGSMKEEQGNLANNFPKFVQKIDSFRTKSGAALDWRAAVTTTGRNLTYSVAPPFPGFPAVPMNEKGDDGAFRSGGSCGMTKKWVEKSDPNAATQFACIAKAGTGGSSIEMPLYATELALRDRVSDGTNAGFLRPDALLAIVILTDEDDCSRKDNNFTITNDACATMKNLVPVSEIKAALDGVAKGAGRWATAVIAGETTCSSSFGNAVAATRLKEFVSLAGPNGTFSSICEGDLTGALEKALDTFDAACKSLPGIK
jgi:hypothetical protein